MKRILFSVTILLAIASCNKKQDSENTQIQTEQNISSEKIVSLNGAITEVLAALGEENNLVGVDVTSTYPETIKGKVADLGHTRTISVESILALKPTKVYATSKDLKPEQIDQLKNAGITVEIINQEISVQGTKDLISQIAKSLNKTDIQSIINTIDQDLKNVKPLENQPKVLFIYARGAGNLMVAGTNTPMEKVIELAGGVNAVKDFEDFKPLTAEAVINANPDYILMFDSGLESIGGVDGILKLEGIANTNAGKNKKVIAMDGQLLSGFGPRVGKAAQELNLNLQK